MNHIQHTVIILLALFVGACVSTAGPTAMNGSFYMIGDQNCIRGYQNQQLANQKRILCLDRNGDITGYRAALTQQEIQMWQHNQLIKKHNQLIDQMEQINTTNRNNAMAIQNELMRMNNELMFFNLMH